MDPYLLLKEGGANEAVARAEEACTDVRREGLNAEEEGVYLGN